MPRTGTLARGALVLLAALMLTGLAASTADGRLAHPLCRQAHPADKCQDGGGRRTPGGGDKASHKGWPAITGVLLAGHRFRRPELHQAGGAQTSCWAITALTASVAGAAAT